MKKYFAQLRPLERRLVVGVAVVLFLVLNLAFWRTHHADWSDLQTRLAQAQAELTRDQATLAQQPALAQQVKVFESEGDVVAPEDQSINLMKTIQAQASASGFVIQSYSRENMRTNQFFVEQSRNIIVSATEEQLVDFLYKLGSGSSMIRVRDLTMQPDPPRQRLNADIKLVASYQKNPSKTNAASPAKISNAKVK
jgi:Tfp pilus assembly protein PilO